MDCQRLLIRCHNLNKRAVQITLTPMCIHIHTYGGVNGGQAGVLGATSSGANVGKVGGAKSKSGHYL